MLSELDFPLGKARAEAGAALTLRGSLWAPSRGEVLAWHPGPDAFPISLFHSTKDDPLGISAHFLSPGG